MKAEGNVIWYGASQRPYRYQVFPIDSYFENVSAVYLLTRKVGKKWKCVAIGRGDLSALEDYKSSAQRWIDGVTHVHICLTSSPISQLIQASDIRNELEIQKLERADRDPVRLVRTEFEYVDVSWN